jgi:hypothetical protein
MQDALDLLLIIHNNTDHKTEEIIDRMERIVAFSREAALRESPESVTDSAGNAYALTALNILINQLRKELEG